MTPIHTGERGRKEEQTRRKRGERGRGGDPPKGPQRSDHNPGLTVLSVDGDVHPVPDLCVDDVGGGGGEGGRGLLLHQGL